MNYELIAQRTEDKALYQVLKNREIFNYEKYLNTIDNDINDYFLLGETQLENAARILLNAIKDNKKVLVIVDSDADGFTSSSLLINYLYDLFPNWTTTKLSWFLHNGKQHGLEDCCDLILDSDYEVIICPDSASNDYEQHLKLFKNNQQIIVLDHHEIEQFSNKAVIINNQSCGYPNKALSGVGVTWQFCRFLDDKLHINNADLYLDLVATGLIADMMDMREVETKHLIQKGLKQIRNPFLVYMAERNKFSLGEVLTPMGVAFYIVPFINAMTRSGTLEEKKLVFKSMLSMTAFNEILSNKRGHKVKETEYLVEQAIRTAINVKNRQTKAETNGVIALQKRIEDGNLLDNKVLLFLLQKGEIDPNIAGLIANKISAYYQRPCCVLTGREEEGEIIYRGSARGCSNTKDFKKLCNDTNAIDWAKGHANAFGLQLPEKSVDVYIDATNTLLKDLKKERTYFVDFLYYNKDINEQDILEIDENAMLWGKSIEEPYIAIKGLKVTKDMVTLMSPDKSPTIKIHLPNIDLVKFKASEEEYEKLLAEGYVEIDVVGYAASNEWNGKTYPQLKIEDYNIVNVSEYFF